MAKGADAPASETAAGKAYIVGWKALLEPMAWVCVRWKESGVGEEMDIEVMFRVDLVTSLWAISG